MEAKRILRLIYNFNKKSKTVTDLDSKKQAFELFDKLRSNTPKRSLSDEDSNDNFTSSQEVLINSHLQTRSQYFKQNSLEVLFKLLNRYNFKI